MTEAAKPLVGRDRELSLLRGFVESTSAASPRFVVVTGEAGIGKSSLLAELVREAVKRGWLALEGRAAEYERELPFGLIVDAFDEYLQSLDGQAFERLDAGGLGALSSVFPSLRALGSGSDHPTSAAERFRVHHAVRELIERLATRQPLVVALDDLHWADGASLELAQHLLRRPPHAPVLFAVAHRTGHADSGFLVAVEAAAGRGAVERVELGPLEAADMDRLLEATDSSERERVYEDSGGNPFYALELARAGAGDRREPSLVDDDGVPATIAAAIAGELDRLSESGLTLGETAAVAGDPFELDLVLDTAGVPEADALAALDELIASDLVRSTGVPRRFRFRHPLVRRAVYGSVPPGSRLAAHKRCAEVLASRGAPATGRAHHIEQSARPGDAAAVAVLREAGEATSTNAPASAARWFGAALRLLPEAGSPEEQVGLLVALSEAQAATGGFEDSRDALLEGIVLTPDDEDALRVRLIGACAGVEQLLGRHEEARTRLATALGRLSDTSSPQAVELMIHLAVGDFYRMDYEGMRKWGERALVATQPLCEPPLTAASRAVLAVAGTFTGAMAEAEAHRSETVALVDAVPDDELGVRLDALANLSAAELYLHRYDDAESHARRGLAIGRATGQGHFSPFLVPVLCTVLHTSGRIAESARLLEGAVDAARLSGNVQTLAWSLLSRAYTAVAAGDLELALNTAQESVDITRELDDNLVSSYAGVALATALFESGDAERAIDVLVTAAGGEELPLMPRGWRANYFELLTRCWLAIGQPMEAELAASGAANTATEVRLPAAVAMAHRAAAAVALEAGDPATAADRALAAAATADEAGARVEAARARTLAGRALARAGERDRAVGELERAAQQLGACGAIRFRQEAERELRKLGRQIHRRTRAGSATGAGVETLTHREAEVAQLVVERYTNPQIAAELFLSVKTVETHMRNIFRKLDVSSRVEVARAIEGAGALRGIAGEVPRRR